MSERLKGLFYFDEEEKVFYFRLGVYTAFSPILMLKRVVLMAGAYWLAQILTAIELVKLNTWFLSPAESLSR